MLGTKLNVHSYPEESYQEFTLESGIIELMKNENRVEFRIIPSEHLHIEMIKSLGKYFF